MKQLTKIEQVKFYQEEIKQILDEYKSYLDSKCLDLINKNELYIGTFEYIDNIRNQVIFSFSKNQIPKTRVPLTASVPKSQEQLNNDFKSISYNSYRNKFVKIYSECIGVYYHEQDGKFNIGFNNFDLEFLNSLSKGDKIVFGISDPPLKYYFNLIQITKNDVKSAKAEEILDGTYHLNDFKTVHIDDSLDLIAKYKSDLKNHDTIIIQGPPGTGKTFFISRLLEVLNKIGRAHV